jgi:hypothetical protein
MFFQIGIQYFGVGMEVDVDMDVGMGVGLNLGVGVGLGLGVGVDVGVGEGVGVGVGMLLLLLLLLLLLCRCCCCACAAAEKLYNTTYLVLRGRSAAVEYVAWVHALSPEHAKAMAWASAQELTLLLTLLLAPSLV